MLRPPSDASAERIEVGIVTKPHGVRGAVKLRLHNPDSDALVDPQRLVVLAGADAAPRAIEHVLAHSGESVIVAVVGCASVDDAEALRGARVYRARASIALGEGEYLYSDLVGCEVREGATSYGRVTRVFCAGASDVLVVQGDEGERMIPLVAQWVETVDIAARVISVSGGDLFEAH